MYPSVAAYNGYLYSVVDAQLTVSELSIAVVAHRVRM